MKLRPPNLQSQVGLPVRATRVGTFVPSVGMVEIVAPVGEVLGGRYRLERLLGAGGMSVSPSPDRIVVRGTTVTLTISSGPRLLSVPYVVGESADDAMGALDDSGFAVAVTTMAVSNDHVGDVVAQDPPGGRAAEGATVTITVGVRQSRRG